MAFLKRKRSESEFSCSSSSSSFSSPTKNGPAHALFQRHPTPVHLPSRTMKRHRDSRPSEQTIHQRTLDLLYDAQKQHQPGPVPPPPMAQPPSGPVSGPPPQQPAQASLHSFWSLPGPGHALPPASSPMAPGPSPVVGAALDTPSHCEDCGHLLRAEMTTTTTSGAAADDDDMDMDMGLDAYGAGPDTGCGACGKHVCSHCSVTHLGEQRRCLMCAGTNPHARKKDDVGMARLFGWPGTRSHAMC